jgi:hypothetical protein
MAPKRAGLLAQIEAGVLDDTVPLSSLLQKCIVLGGKAGSDKLRAWARQELNGYADLPSIPDYRHLRAQVMLVITNRAGYNPLTQPLSESDLRPQHREILASTNVELSDVPLGGSIGELEAMASSGEDVHKLVPGWADVMLKTLNDHYIDSATSHAASIYWSVSRVSLQGLLVRVRTALAELVAELITLTPEDQEVPDREVADAVAIYMFTGDRNIINNLHATAGGTNVTAGAHGTAIGGQAVQGDHNTVAGRDATSSPAEELRAKEGWWARLRKRGALVAFTTIIGGIASVAAVVIAWFTWVGWTPWS